MITIKDTSLFLVGSNSPEGLVSLVSLTLVGNYASATDLIGLKMPLLRGVGATLSPVFLSLSYLAAKLSRKKRDKELHTVFFFFFFMFYSVWLRNSDILAIFGPTSFLLFMIVLGLGLAKKLDLVFG